MKLEISIKWETKISFLSSLDQHLRSIIKNHGKSFAIIADKNVWDLYETQIKEAFSDLTLHVIQFDAKDAEKNLMSVEKIYQTLVHNHCRKDTVIIGLGGGVILDMAGFAAATYQRGLSFISIPTTLLAMVDACLGGKTGVNFQDSKNYIGSFYPAKEIAIYPGFLQSISSSEIRMGMAEVIKYALIWDKDLFFELEKCHLPKNDPVFWKNLVQKCLQIKLHVIEKDPLDQSLRNILNFGHTIGHAIESSSNYVISHGAAVAIGMIVESRLSLLEGHISQTDFDHIYTLIKNYKYPLLLPKDISIDSYIQLLLKDKKASNGLVCVLLSSIGSCFHKEMTYAVPIKKTVMEEVLTWMKKEFKEIS